MFAIGRKGRKEQKGADEERSNEEHALLTATHSMISVYFGKITIVLKFPFTSAASAKGLHRYKGFSFASPPLFWRSSPALAEGDGEGDGEREGGGSGPESLREGVGERRGGRGARFRLGEGVR